MDRLITILSPVSLSIQNLQLPRDVPCGEKPLPRWTFYPCLIFTIIQLQASENESTGLFLRIADFSYRPRECLPKAWEGVT